MMVSGILSFLDVSIGGASGADAGGEVSRGCDASGSRDFCFECRGGGLTTTAKSGIDFRGLSGDLPNPLTVTPFGLGVDVLDLCFNDWLKWARLMSRDIGFG